MGKRFSDDDGRAVYQFTHVCVRCWKLFKMTFDKTGQVWKTNEALHQLKMEHSKNIHTHSRKLFIIVRASVSGTKGGEMRRRGVQEWRNPSTAGVEEEKYGDTESENEEEPPQAAKEPVSVCDWCSIWCAVDNQSHGRVWESVEELQTSSCTSNTPAFSNKDYHFGTFITVADNKQDEVEINSD